MVLPTAIVTAFSLIGEALSKSDDDFDVREILSKVEPGQSLPELVEGELIVSVPEMRIFDHEADMVVVRSMWEGLRLLGEELVTLHNLRLGESDEEEAAEAIVVPQEPHVDPVREDVLRSLLRPDSQKDCNPASDPPEETLKVWGV